MRFDGDWREERSDFWNFGYDLFFPFFPLSLFCNESSQRGENKKMKEDYYKGGHRDKTRTSIDEKKRKFARIFFLPIRFSKRIHVPSKSPLDKSPTDFFAASTLKERTIFFDCLLEDTVFAETFARNAMDC